MFNGQTVAMDQLSLSRPRRLYSALLAIGFLGTQVSPVAAHGGEQHFPLAQWDGLAILFLGIVLISVAVMAKRQTYVTPTTSLGGVFLGILLVVVGAILFEGLSPDPTYTAATLPFPRSWYTPIAMGVGLLIATVSLVGGFLRWPDRPRYAALGILTSIWILYPELLPAPGRYTNPVGYLVVLMTPALVGYIIWKDARDVLGAVLQDRVVRRFAIGVGFLITVFFVTSTGYLTFFWDEDAPRETVFVVLPVVYQLVQWPTLEIGLPSIPLFIALSPGLIVLTGIIGTLVGLNAAMVARYWRVEEQAGIAEGSAGTVAIAGSCTCGCCGPLVAKFAVVAAGPSIAAPIYWLFVDSASPLGVLFIVGSIVLFTGMLVYSTASARSESPSVCAVPAD
jgi:hypothetical protein